MASHVDAGPALAKSVADGAGRGGRAAAQWPNSI
jgi:hypothetical protein